MAAVTADIVKNFLVRTKSDDETLARDILEGTNWSLDDAVDAFYQMGCDYANPDKSSCRMVEPQIKAAPLKHLSPPTEALQMKDNAGKTSPRLSRGISKITDVQEANAARENILNAISEESKNPPVCLSPPPNYDSGDGRLLKKSEDIRPLTTFVLPDLTIFTGEFRQYLEAELIDIPTLRYLEKTGHLNWWQNHKTIQDRLYPVYTTGDGNCLLHAASLAMWGVHDRQLALRKALHDKLTNEKTGGALYRRWRWQQMQDNKEMGLVLSEQEWESEWQGLLRLASTHPKTYDDCGQSGDQENSEYYESLEEFHVFVLSHILRRPIVIFAEDVLRDVEGQAMAPIPFSGVFLPLEDEPGKCCQAPLLLAYDRSHFSAVVSMDTSAANASNNRKSVLVPLTSRSCDLLPLHFIVDPGPNVDWENLTEDNLTTNDVIRKLGMYLKTRYVPVNPGSSSSDSLDSLGDNVKGQGYKVKGKTAKDLTTMKGTKAIDKFTNIVKKSKSKFTKIQVAEAVASQELDPGDQFILCAEMEERLPNGYHDTIAKYLSQAKMRFEENRRKLATVKSINGEHKQTRDSALETISRTGVKTAQLCQDCRGAPVAADHDGRCSNCYHSHRKQFSRGDTSRSRQYELLDSQQQLETRPCKKCKEFTGTAETNYYCSKCYADDLKAKSINASSVVHTHKTDYSIPIHNLGIGGAGGDDIHRAVNAEQQKHTISVSLDSQPTTRPFPLAISSHAGNKDLILDYDRSYPSELDHKPAQHTITLGLGEAKDGSALRMVSSTNQFDRKDYNTEPSYNVYAKRDPDSSSRETLYTNRPLPEHNRDYPSSSRGYHSEDPIYPTRMPKSSGEFNAHTGQNLLKRHEPANPITRTIPITKSMQERRCKAVGCNRPVVYPRLYCDKCSIYNGPSTHHARLLSQLNQRQRQCDNYGCPYPASNNQRYCERHYRMALESARGDQRDRIVDSKAYIRW